MLNMFEIDALNKSFGSLAVTQDVSLQLPAGRRHGLIGPNGAGKTTLFNLLCGELDADSGRVMLDGADITRASPDTRARAGLARSFQRNNLFTELTVRENLVIACTLQQGIGHIGWNLLRRYDSVATEVEASIEQLGLGDDADRPVKQLSYGTQRQLEIGLALQLQPKVLLLDEPTSGMSPEETTAMQSLIGELPDTLTVLIIEHDMDVIFDIAERITVLDYGRVLLEGTPEEVRKSDQVRQRYLGDEVS
tara:strand:+ start:147 stop:896 length:750 start_codon:yes stop_codon:yes gene_type:complete